MGWDEFCYVLSRAQPGAMHHLVESHSTHGREHPNTLKLLWSEREAGHKAHP